MAEEKNSSQASEATLVAAEPVAETVSAPKPRRKRRTKAEIEADAKKAAAKAKRDAKKAAAAAKNAADGALDTAAKAAKKTVEGGARVAEKITNSLIPATEIVLQYSGAEIEAATLADAAVAQFRAAKKRARIKDIKLYLKPEERAAYYVINGSFSGKVDF